MRLLVFSDLHGNQYAWSAFLKAITDINYDKAVFLGDVFGYYYGQQEILSGLMGFPGLIWLKGNHEDFFENLVKGEETLINLTERYGSSYLYCLNNLAGTVSIFADMPHSCLLEIDGQRILLCHGTPDDPANGRLYPKDTWFPSKCGDYDVVICGHTHFRMVREGGEKLWLNAGSLGQPRDGNKSGYLIYDTNTKSYEFRDVLYDRSPVFHEIEKNDPELKKLKEVLEREKS